MKNCSISIYTFFLQLVWDLFYTKFFENWGMVAFNGTLTVEAETIKGFSLT